MKTLASAAIMAALLTGCTSTPEVDWTQGSQSTNNHASIELKSNLWVDLMPSIGEVKQSSLHGAIAIQSEEQLPANLTVEALVIKQGDTEWYIGEDVLETRTHSENQWEVIFNWAEPLNTERWVDLAILIDDEEGKRWLVERSVKINKVY